MTSRETPVRTRREPPRFRQVQVQQTEPLNPWMIRLRLAGDDLDGLEVTEPAASVRLLIPQAAEDTDSDGELVMPTWSGNEFLRADGTRPAIRTLTPSYTTSDSRELDVHIVLHGAGVASNWARLAEPGTPAALAGVGRGYQANPDAPQYLIAGDATALPAITQVLTAVPVDVPTQILVELPRLDAKVDLPTHPQARVDWLVLPSGAGPGDALVDAVQQADLSERAQVWAAGEAAAVQRIRRHLFDDRGLDRSRTTVRGYWKRDRPGS